jgi:hypothetical protein
VDVVANAAEANQERRFRALERTSRAAPWTLGGRRTASSSPPQTTKEPDKQELPEAL